MPVIRTSEKDLQAGNRPDWCRVTGAGRWSVKCKGGRFDPHHHDFNEYWLIYAGRAKVRSEGVDYYVKPGDIVCTATGEEHDVLEVYEDLEAFYFEEECPPGGRTGHLHKSPQAAKGHPVPHRPLPRDFPA